ncbi:MAG: hypothetical protein ACRDG6_06825 [Candidatus Limnocylindria bacterium]
MANGKLGDHPLTDIVIHRSPTFTPAIDALVRQVHDWGGFESQLSSGFLMQMEERLYEADERTRKTILHNLEFILEAERTRLGKGRTR